MISFHHKPVIRTGYTKIERILYMKKIFFKTMITGLLVLSLTLTACAGPAADKSTTESTQTEKTNPKEQTIGQLADYFIQAADDYRCV